MPGRRETILFASVLASLLGALFFESLFLGKVLSPADVLRVQASFGDDGAEPYEPANRLLIDPVLQFEPWLELNRRELREGRLPVWNPMAGLGAPHLANGQSGVFDPFHVIAYVGSLPRAYGWMAVARLETAGLGMFLLCGAWGMGPMGRWFAGLVFPFSGFLVCWLLYPVSSSAVWMPWIFWATERLVSRVTARRVGVLGLLACCSILGGHIQTTAHVLLGACVFAIWSAWPPRRGYRALAAWAGGMLLGVVLGMCQILPLAGYLSRSHVWADRGAERESPLAVPRPRVLDAACTVFPYLYGSQRRGQPNLARGLGVQNLNESAGGFCGAITLLWLAPAAWSQRRKLRLVRFLVVLTVVGAMGGFDVPPVANMLRALPVIDVIDARRMTLWVAFGMTVLAGIGLPHALDWARSAVGQWSRRGWIAAGTAMVVGACAVPAAETWLRGRAAAHYASAVEQGTVNSAIEAKALAARQVENVVTFMPHYLTWCAGLLGTMAVLSWAAARGLIARRAAYSCLAIVAFVDLGMFGWGLNPAIPAGWYRPQSLVIDYLREVSPLPYRVLALDAELPPNVLMRYGLADCRNYDSVELASSLRALDGLFESDDARGMRTSRGRVSWEGVISALDRWRTMGVNAVVSRQPPPAGTFLESRRIGSAWVTLLGATPRKIAWSNPGETRIDGPWDWDHREVVPVSYDPGWMAEADGRRVPVTAHEGALLEVEVPCATSRLVLRYRPWAVSTGVALSAAGLLVTLWLTSRAGGQGEAGKNHSRAWMPALTRSRIGESSSFPSSRRTIREGCDANGPLHV
jgi:hypothetical protein